MNKEELRDWLLENCLNDNGDLVICDIDLSDFKGNVILNGWKIGRTGYVDLSSWDVKGNLYQDYQTAKNLYQSCQKVNGNLYQSCQKVNGNLDQSFQRVNGNLDQSFQIVGYKLKEK